jgi:hypothetical protein
VFAAFFLLVSCLAYATKLKMEAVCSSESLINFCFTTQRHMSDDSNLHSQRCEGPKCSMFPAVSLLRSGSNPWTRLSFVSAAHSPFIRADSRNSHCARPLALVFVVKILDRVNRSRLRECQVHTTYITQVNINSISISTPFCNLKFQVSS